MQRETYFFRVSSCCSSCGFSSTCLSNNTLSPGCGKVMWSFLMISGSWIDIIVRTTVSNHMPFALAALHCKVGTCSSPCMSQNHGSLSPCLFFRDPKKHSWEKRSRLKLTEWSLFFACLKPLSWPALCVFKVCS